MPLRPRNSDEPPGPTTAPAIDVEVSDRQSHLAIDPEALAALAARVLRGEHIGRASISIALVDDAAIHELNRRHLSHDWPTDVITFGLSAPGDPAMEAELVVSAEMAATTAGASGADPLDELALYVVHGLLHLCGYDDLTPEDAAAMRVREGEVLAGLGLSNPFAKVGPPADVPGRAGGSER